MRTSVPRGEVPTTVVKDGDAGRTAVDAPEPNGKPAAAAGTQGMPRKLQRRGARQIDVSPLGPNRGSL